MLAIPQVTMEFTACTIVSNNYLPFARVLARSFLEHHAAGRFFCLIVDRPQQQIDYAAEPFEVVFVEDLGIPAFRNMAYRYNVLELNTAVKPYFLTDLAKRSRSARLCYFDPDILICSELGELYGQLEQADLLLTPHITDSLEDQAHPSERDILNAGIYNMGFLGISFNERTLRYLGWWQSRLHRQGINRIEQGLFVDQKWMDFAPAFLPQAQVVCDPGCNVAYWNLAHRRPERRRGNWEVQGRPLRFFHFSGFSPYDLERVSRHQNRFTLSDLSCLRPLFELYRGRLLDEGYDELISLPYAYNSFGNGVAVPDCSRQTLHEIDPDGRRWPDPFDTSRPDSFFDWLRGAAYPSVPLPRLALSCWDQDPLCRSTFALEDDGGRVRFARWFVEQGLRHCGADEVFVESLKLFLSSPDQPSFGPSIVRKEDRHKQVSWILGRPNPQAALKFWFDGLGGARGFWLEEEALLEAVQPFLSRFALALHRSRQDVMDSFPNPLGSSRKAFAWWFVSSARWEYELPPEAIDPVIDSLPPLLRLKARLWWRIKVMRSKEPGKRHSILVSQPEAQSVAVASDQASPARSTEHGVHVVGYLNAPTGKGQEARAALEALQWSGFPHRAWTIDPATQGFDEAGHRMAADSHPDFPVALFFINADQTQSVFSQLPASLRAAPIRIAHWDWELSHFPLGYAHQFQGLGEVWTSSRFSLRAISALSPLPVRWVPPCVPAGQSEPASRAELGIPEGPFLFYNAYDHRSIPERKNPQGLIEAFRILCQRTDRPVHLLVKANHISEHPEALKRLKEKAQGLPVSWLTDTLSRAQTDALMAACDCYVSLHRSEGIGLPLIEAMYLGKPVVATAYSGCRDFLDGSTGWPVDYRLQALQESYGPYPEGAVWAEPDVEAAARRMEEVLSSPDPARLERARQRVTALYSHRAAAERLDRELHRIMGKPQSHREHRGD